MKLVECGDHLLDLQRIQAVADVCGDYQHCNIWCHRHNKYEWQWLCEQLPELDDDSEALSPSIGKYPTRQERH